MQGGKREERRHCVGEVVTSTVGVSGSSIIHIQLHGGALSTVLVNSN